MWLERRKVRRVDLREMCDVFDKRAEPGTGFYEPHEPAELIKQHFGVEDRAVPILSADEQALFAGIASSKLFTIAGAKKQFGVGE